MTDVIYDFETFSLNLGFNNLPWQFAAVFAENGKITKKVNVFIDVGDPNQISADARRITRFNDAEYHANKKDPASVWKSIKRVFLDENNTLIGHNVLGFDIYILRNLARYVGDDINFDDFIYRTRDTISMGRADYFKSPMPKDPLDILAWQYKYLHKPVKTFKSSLGAMAAGMNISYDKDKAHDALYDVEVGYEIYKNLVYRNND